jgi:pimeloyl-ACP methyl ester carboxylesterase
MSKPGVLFVSGAGLSDWIWSEVTDALQVPSAVADFTKARQDKDATLSDYVDEAAKAIEKLKVDHIIIVAHSIGGVVGIELARQYTDRTVGLIGVSAVIPKPGDNFMSSLPFPQKLIMPVVVKFAGTKPPESSIRNSLASGVQTELVDELVKTYQPEAKGLYFGKTSTSSFPTIPYCYIFTTNDKELPKSVQDKSSKRLPEVTRHVIESGHLPMLSHPEKATSIIKKFIKTVS